MARKGADKGKQKAGETSKQSRTKKSTPRRGRGGRSKGRAVHLWDEPDEEEEQQESETDEEIERQVSQQVNINKVKPRGHSKGSWGNKPPRPIRISFEKGQ